jgi:hypothetical protein
MKLEIHCHKNKQSQRNNITSPMATPAGYIPTPMTTTIATPTTTDSESTIYTKFEAGYYVVQRVNKNKDYISISSFRIKLLPREEEERRCH